MNIYIQNSPESWEHFNTKKNLMSLQILIMPFAALYCYAHAMFPGKWTLKEGPVRIWVLR